MVVSAGLTGVDVVSASSNVAFAEMEKGRSSFPSSIHDMENLESGIPGLDSSARNDGFSDQLAASSLASTDIEDASQDQATSAGQSSSLNLLPSMSTERSEDLSPKATVADVNSLASSTATSLGFSSHVVLPKMSAPVVNLADEEKDKLQQVAFVRILEAYKQIAVAGGSQIQFSLLSYLGVQVEPITTQRCLVSLAQSLKLLGLQFNA